MPRAPEAGGSSHAPTTLLTRSGGVRARTLPKKPPGLSLNRDLPVSPAINGRVNHSRFTRHGNTGIVSNNRFSRLLNGAAGPVPRFIRLSIELLA